MNKVFFFGRLCSSWISNKSGNNSPWRRDESSRIITFHFVSVPGQGQTIWRKNWRNARPVCCYIQFREFLCDVSCVGVPATLKSPTFSSEMHHGSGADQVYMFTSGSDLSCSCHSVEKDKCKYTQPDAQHILCIPCVTVNKQILSLPLAPSNPMQKTDMHADNTSAKAEWDSSSFMNVSSREYTCHNCSRRCHPSY